MVFLVADPHCTQYSSSLPQNTVRLRHDNVHSVLAPLQETYLRTGWYCS